MGRSAGAWVGLSLLLFPVGSAAALILLGWLGEDVWFAHAIHVDDDEIRKFAATGCGTRALALSNFFSRRCTLYK